MATRVRRCFTPPQTTVQINDRTNCDDLNGRSFLQPMEKNKKGCIGCVRGSERYTGVRCEEGQETNWGKDSLIAPLSNQGLRPSSGYSGRKGSEWRRMGEWEGAGNGREWIVDIINWYGARREARKATPGRPGALNFDYQGSEGA